MAKDPAFLFYYDRFLGGTFMMSHEQVGKYIRLLCVQANKGHLTLDDISGICADFSEPAAKKFVEISPGVYKNRALDEIMQSRRTFTESRRNNRLGKTRITSDNLVNNTSETLDKLVVNVNVNKNINTDIRLNITFDEFWALYDKKVGDKEKLAKKWVALTDEEREKAMWHIPQYKTSQPDKKFRKDPGTYLNNKSFNDEIISNGTTATGGTGAGKAFNGRNGGFQIAVDNLKQGIRDVSAGGTARTGNEI